MVPDGDGRRGAPSRGQDDLPAVDLWFSGIRELTHRMRPWISTDGIFVATPEPKPPSSVVRVRLILADGFVLAEGTAVVVWARTTADSPGGDPGMGMRWVVIPEPSRRVIEQLVAEHEADGGEAFDPDHLPEGDLASEAMGLDAEPTVIRSLPEAEPAQPRPTAEVGGTLRIRSEASPAWPPPDALAGTGVEGGQRPTDLEPPEPRSGDRRPIEPPHATREHVPTPTGPPGDGAGAVAPAAPGGDRESSPQGPSRHAVEPAAPPDIVMPDDDQSVAEKAPRRRTIWPWLAAAAVVLVGVGVTVRILGWSPVAGRAAQPTAHEITQRPTAPEPRAEGLPTPAAADEAAHDRQIEPGAGSGSASLDTSQVTPRESPTELPSPVASVGSIGGDSGADAAPHGVAGITWSREAGATVVEIGLGSKLASKDVSVSQFDHPPRILVRIPDVSEPFSPLLVPVGSPELAQVRSWLHMERRPPELHVVLDLAGDRASLVEVRREAHAIVLVIGGGAPRNGPS